MTMSHRWHCIFADSVPTYARAELLSILALTKEPQHSLNFLSGALLESCETPEFLYRSDVETLSASVRLQANGTDFQSGLESLLLIII